MTKFYRTRAAIAFAIAGALIAQTAAQEGQSSEGGVQQEVDTSGTNPAVLSRTLQISNEYRSLNDSDNYHNVTNFRYTEQFLDGKPR
jgi:hypothetical protein